MGHARLSTGHSGNELLNAKHHAYEGCGRASVRTHVLMASGRPEQRLPSDS